MGAFDTRRKGEKLNIYAEEYNDFLAGSKARRADNTGNNVPKGDHNTQNSIVFVKNVSDDVVKQYECMVIEEFIFNPVSNDQTRTDNAFKAQASFKVNVYDESDDKHRNARIVILQEPIGEGKVGKAMISGSSQIRVNILDQKHNCFTLISGETILESSTGGEISSVAKQALDGEGWAYGSINDIQTKKQFKIIGLLENDIVTCFEYKDGVTGSLVYKIALPYLNRRTPFDGKVDPSDPQFRYEYSDFNLRKAFRLDDEEYEDALSSIESAEANLTTVINNGTPEEIEEAEEELATATAALTNGSIAEEEEDQELTPSYKEGQILYASRCISGGVDVFDANNEPVEWIVADDVRWWFEDEDPPEDDE